MFTFKPQVGNGKGYDIFDDKGRNIATISLLLIGKLDAHRDSSNFDAYYRTIVEHTESFDGSDVALPTYDDIYEFCADLFYMDTDQPGSLYCHRVSLYQEKVLDNQYVVVGHYGFDV